MVEGEGQGDRRPRRHLTLHHQRPRLDHAQRQDGRLGMVDDGGAELGTERADVRQRDGSSGHLVRADPARPGGLGQPDDLAPHLEDALASGVAHHRHQQAALGLRGDADVAAFEHHDLRALGVEG